MPASDPVLTEKTRDHVRWLAAGRLTAATQRLSAGGSGAERSAAEWLLDNFYIVERAFRLVREEFTPAFERRLPWAAEPLPPAPEPPGPIAYVLACEIVTETGDHVEPEAVTRVVAEFQSVRPLSMAEVWALPVLLRIVLLESLAGAVAAALPADGAAGDPSADARVAGCIRSLRTWTSTRATAIARSSRSSPVIPRGRRKRSPARRCVARATRPVAAVTSATT